MAVIVEAGSLILTPAEARMLYQGARIWEIRSRYRTVNPQLFELLTKIALAATARAPIAAGGNSARQSAASEEREWWTTQQLARATRLAERTVRLACHNGELAGATLTDRRWRIPAQSAKAFVTIRTTKKNGSTT